jgi:hypothetical protein
MLNLRLGNPLRKERFDRLMMQQLDAFIAKLPSSRFQYAYDPQKVRMILSAW